MLQHLRCYVAGVCSLRACLHGVGDPGLVGLVSSVFTLWRTQNKRNLPHKTAGSPTPCKQGLRSNVCVENYWWQCNKTKLQYQGYHIQKEQRSEENEGGWYSVSKPTCRGNTVKSITLFLRNNSDPSQCILQLLFAWSSFFFYRYILSVPRSRRKNV